MKAHNCELYVILRSTDRNQVQGLSFPFCSRAHSLTHQAVQELWRWVTLYKQFSPLCTQAEYWLQGCNSRS